MKLFEELKNALTLKIVLIIAACVAGLVVMWWVFATYDNWRERRETEKIKANINTMIDQAKTEKSNVADLKNERSEKIGEIKEAKDLLDSQIYGHEDAKNEANQALANYEKALKTNSNVDRTADDLKRAIERLEATQK